jgi:nitronate monooxygenase
VTLPSSLADRLRLPVVASPMFLVSNPDLVIAQCTAGIVGSFPALNARPVSQLDEWLARIVEELAQWDREHPDQPAAPFAVNQIVHRSNTRLEQDVELMKYGYRGDHSVPGKTSTPPALLRRLAFHDIINSRHAHKAIERY